MTGYSEKQLARFWAKVNKNGAIPAAHPELGACWQWTGGGNGYGYGQVRISYRQVRADQFSWELARGEVPPGKLVLHKCDNHLCVNPAHLFLGTRQDNARTMQSKGRRGGNYKLTREQVADIRQRAAEGVSQRQLAAEMGVTDATISLIVNHKNWQR